MAHLGQGTSITTVGDKEIVLTASDGQTFKMKITDLAEAVRQVMPMATKLSKGLAIPFSNPERYELKGRDTIEIVVNSYGFYSISSDGLVGSSCIFYLSYDENSSKVLLGSISTVATVRLKGAGLKILVITSVTDSRNEILVNRI